MADVTLYQFALCPFCNKVRAGLEIKGIPFDSVEVSPRNKKELPPLPENTKKKVPVLQKGDTAMAGSKDILHYLDDHFESEIRLKPTEPEAQKQSDEIENWIDDQFIQALPTVLYGTKKEAKRAAQVIAKSSKMGALQKLAVGWAGSFMMQKIAKRILKKHGKTDAHAWVQENVDQFGQWLADKPFVLGTSISMGDVAMHGALTAVQEFPIFEKIMSKPSIQAWYTRVDALRQAHRAPA